MIKRLLTVTLFHATFSTFGEIEANFMSQLSIPLSQMFNESIQQNYGFVPTEMQLSTANSIVASCLYIGLLFGAFLTGQFMDSLGRKPLRMFGLLAAISAIFSSLSTSIELFAFSHFLTGIGVSLKIVLIVYLSECASDDCRGTVAIMLGSGVAIIQLVVQPLFLPEVFGNSSDWIAIPMINIVLCIIHMVIGSFLPDSPKHLYLNKHRTERAKQSIMFYQGRRADTAEVLAEYEREKSLLHSEHLKLKEIWKERHTRIPFLIVFIASLVPATSAISVKSQYLQGMLVDMGMSSSTASFSILTLVFATTPFALLAPSLIEKVGRRLLFLTMSVLCCIEWAFLGFSQWNVGTKIGPPIGMFGIAAGNIAFMLGILNITPILINELCPFGAKAKVTEFIQFVPVLITMGTFVLYAPIVHAFGSLYHLIMLIISLALFYTLYKILPETRLIHVDSIVRQLLHESPNDYGSIDAVERR